MSGGPVVTAAGELVGINQRLYSPEGVLASTVQARHVEALLYSLPG